MGKKTKAMVALPSWTTRWLGVIGVLALVELLTQTDILPGRYIPPVSTTFLVLVEQLQSSALWVTIWETLKGWAIGLAIATVVAVPVGMLLGSIQLLYRGVRVIIEFLRPIPSVALIPLAVLIYGAGLAMKVFLVSFASFWPLLFQTLYGVQDIDPVARDTARAYGLSRLSYVRYIVLPSAAPYIATGLRISSSIALILAVTGELVVGAPGIGREIGIAQSGGDAPLTYALISVAGVLGLVLNAIFQRLERLGLHWHASQRREVV
jgi:ABC-type nitrate/sulfonate/bicarbonate transport system permease component